MKYADVIIKDKVEKKFPKDCYCITVCNSHGDGDLYTNTRALIKEKEDFINIFFLVKDVMSYLKNNVVCVVNSGEVEKIDNMIYETLKARNLKEKIVILDGTENSGYEIIEIFVIDLIFILAELDVTNMDCYAKPTNIKATYFDCDGCEFELCLKVEIPTDKFFDFEGF